MNRANWIGKAFACRLSTDSSPPRLSAMGSIWSPATSPISQKPRFASSTRSIHEKLHCHRAPPNVFAGGGNTLAPVAPGGQFWRRKRVSVLFLAIFLDFLLAERDSTSIFPPFAAGRPRFWGFSCGFLDPKHGPFEASPHDLRRQGFQCARNWGNFFQAAKRIHFSSSADPVNQH